MVEKKYYLLISAILLAVFLTGVLYGTRRAGPTGSADGRRILYYVDPMNPAHTSPEPGLAPCGMKMEPVYADSPEGDMPPPFLPPGSVRITPQKQQLIGVRTEEVEKAPFTHTLRSLARVTIDETRIYRLNSFVDGWIQTVHPYSTGSLVTKNEVLAAYSSREIINEMQIYLATLGQVDRNPRDDRRLFVNYQVRVRKAEEGLKSLGMSDLQIQELAETRRVTQEIYLAAPVTSFVLARNVSPGQRISKGDELYRLADLSRVWIVADLYEHEAAWVKPGTKVRATLPHGNLEVWATVTDILPEFDKVSRTLRVRLEADNPGYALRPDMFMDAEFPINLPATVTVPVDAILHSGLKKTVFVERGNGYFEPRQVETGWRFGDRVEITRGLEPGERIVISGNFLVDSESRMKLAAAGFVGEVALDPVIGVNVDESKAKVAGLQSEYKNRTYFFHSEETKRQFEQNPERYLEMAAKRPEASGAVHQEKAAPGMVRCAVCDHEVDEAQARAKGLTSEYQGKTYYFCRYYCNREFDKSPQRYVKEASSPGAHSDHKEKDAPLIVKDPVCGLEVNRAEAAAQRLKRGYQGHEYYFCRDYCARQFDKAPESYVPSLAPHQAPKDGPETVTLRTPGLEGTGEPHGAAPKPALARDPVCGMEAETTGDDVLKTYYEGKFYYFCSDRCKEQFDLDPQRYLEGSAPTLTPPVPIAPPPATPAPASAPGGLPKPQPAPANPAHDPVHLDQAIRQQAEALIKQGPQEQLQPAARRRSRVPRAGALNHPPAGPSAPPTAAPPAVPPPAPPTAPGAGE